MEREELETLLGNIDRFTGEIFDAVGPLKRVDFLHAVQDFRIDVEKRLEETA